jgi:hypothetical protein
LSQTFAYLPPYQRVGNQPLRNRFVCNNLKTSKFPDEGMEIASDLAWLFYPIRIFVRASNDVVPWQRKLWGILPFSIPQAQTIAGHAVWNTIRAVSSQEDFKNLGGSRI